MPGPRVRRSAVDPRWLDLPESEIHVWSLDAGSMSRRDLEMLARSLSADEIGSSDGFRRQEDRAEFVAARGAVRRLLGRYLGVDPGSVVFRRGEYGKPRIESPYDSGIEFNVSHSGRKALMAFSIAGSVGIDIERHDPSMLTPAILPEVFTECEQRELESLPPALKLKGFFTAWTRKEAFIKAVGEGLHIDLQSFSVDLDPRNPPSIRPPERFSDTPWQIVPLSLYPGYEAALVYPGEALTVRLRAFRASGMAPIT